MATRESGPPGHFVDYSWIMSYSETIVPDRKAQSRLSNTSNAAMVSRFVSRAFLRLAMWQEGKRIRAGVALQSTLGCPFVLQVERD
jgi:hypothetical protein